ncbi:hypothetical protein D3C87_1407120 [compost metagenome]
MGDGVHAGGGRQHRWQAEGQFRIADGHARHHVRRDDAYFAAVVEDQDGAATDFAAGAGGGRNRDQRRGGRGDAVQPAFNHRKALQRAFMRRANRHAFGQIDGRTAADRDDAVALALAVLRDGFTHGVFVRVRWGGVENRVRTVDAESGNDLVDDAGVAHAHVGDDQRTGDVGAVGFGGQMLQAVIAELDFGDVIDEGHDSPQVIQDCYCCNRPVVAALLNAGQTHCIA